MSLLSSVRERSKKRKELLKNTLGVSDLSVALGTSLTPKAKPEKETEDEDENEDEASKRRKRDQAKANGSGSKTARNSEEFRDSTAFLKGTQSLNPHNDYSQNFVDTYHRPQNFIRDVGLADRFEEYPKLRELIRLKNELIAKTAHPPMYLKCDLETFDLKSGLSNSKFDVILVEPPLEEYSRSCGVTNVKFWDWDKIMALDLGDVAASRSFIFLWCGSSDGLDLGRLCLQNWGFRRCEDICWIQTNHKNQCSKVLEPNAVFQRTKEHCLMGIKGTVRRSTDGDFIHANVDIDLIIDDDADPGSLDKPVEMFHIIEHFCLGTRRLMVFGRDTTIRPGWLTIGPELSMSNWDPAVYASYFVNGTTTGCTDKIEALRPKSPPPKAGGRGRGRGGRGRGGDRGGGAGGGGGGGGRGRAGNDNGGGSGGRGGGRM